MDIVNRVERYAPLEDIQIRSGGSGRVVDAYAAVFNTRQEIRDQEGHYVEELAPQSFERTLTQRAGRFQVMFNHGKTMYGTPSERFSMPLGTPLELRAEPRGLFTSTEYAKTELADEVLSLIDSGAIRGMSFSGAFVGTEKPGKDPATGLPIHRRTEIAMREYGPTPFPAYQEARIEQVRHDFVEVLGVLNTEELVAHLRALPDSERAAIAAALETPAADTGTGSDSSDTGHVVVIDPNREDRLRLERRVLAEIRGII